MAPVSVPPRSAPGDELARLERATASLDPPFALLDLEALWVNATDLVRRAAGKPIRLASKSVRCRAVQQRTLERDGFEGTLAFTLPEALWLASHGFEDLVVAYPTADRAALRRLDRLNAEQPHVRITLMIDSVEQLDLIDAATGPRSASIRVCLDIDAGLWLLKGRLRAGAKRSPVHTVAQAVARAQEVAARDNFELAGLMTYEAQVAGLGDAPRRKPARALAIRALQSLSLRELSTRRADVVAAVSRIAQLDFVNGGGTGSVERTARASSITEVAAGSGLFGPTLFDSYRAFKPRPAAIFALPVVRRPAPGIVTVLGGGYLASGPSDSSRLPRPHLPRGLRLDRREGAGEVQTPLLGAAAHDLQIGDRVYFRHAKAGELCERFDRLFLIEGDRIADEVPTYRGEGRCFL